MRGLLLFSEADGLPFLEVDEKGTAFDDHGPFAGFFCPLEGPIEIYCKRRKGFCVLRASQVCRGRYLPELGGFKHFSDEQYSDLNCVG